MAFPPKSLRSVHPLLLLSVAGAGAFLVGTWLFRPFTASDTDFAKVRRGMSLAEVRAALGGPPSNETYTVVTEVSCNGTVRQRSRTEHRVWTSETRELTVDFDEQGRVAETRIRNYESANLWHRVRRGVGL
jgi:hypothetical protein